MKSSKSARGLSALAAAMGMAAGLGMAPAQAGFGGFAGSAPSPSFSTPSAPQKPSSPLALPTPPKAPTPGASAGQMPSASAAGLAQSARKQGETFTPSMADQRRMIAKLVAANPTEGLNLQNLGSFGGQIDRLLALGIPADAIVAKLRRGAALGAAQPGMAASDAAFQASVSAAERMRLQAAASEAQRAATLRATVDRLKMEQAEQARMLAAGVAGPSPAAPSAGPILMGGMTQSQIAAAAAAAGMPYDKYAYLLKQADAAGDAVIAGGMTQRQLLAGASEAGMPYDKFVYLARQAENAAASVPGTALSAAPVDMNQVIIEGMTRGQLTEAAMAAGVSYDAYVSSIRQRQAEKEALAASFAAPIPSAPIPSAPIPSAPAPVVAAPVPGTALSVAPVDMNQVIIEGMTRGQLTEAAMAAGVSYDAYVSSIRQRQAEKEAMAASFAGRAATSVAAPIPSAPAPIPLPSSLAAMNPNQIAEAARAAGMTPDQYIEYMRRAETR